jgi:hypothetical protein
MCGFLTGRGREKKDSLLNFNNRAASDIIDFYE